MTRIIKLLILSALMSGAVVLGLANTTQASDGVASPKSVSRVLDLRAAPVITGTKVDLLWQDNDGDTEADGGDTLRYRIVIRNSGTSTATAVMLTDMIDQFTGLAVGTLKVSPLAINDRYATAGNTLLEVGSLAPPSSAPKVSSSHPITSNDRGFDGLDSLDVDSNIAIDTMDATSAQGGTVTNEGGGSFTYLPPLGFRGIDGFAYIIRDTNSGLTDTGRVSITIGTRVFYVKNDVAGPGTGSSTDPFDTLAAAENAANQAGDIIFVHEGDGTTTNQNVGVSLLDDQQLIGEGANLFVDGRLLFSTGSPPSIGNPGGDGVTLAENNTVLGLVVESTGGAAFIDDGDTVGTLTVDSVTITGTGDLLEVSNGGSLAVTFDSLSTTSANTAIKLDGVGGSLTVSDGAGTDTDITGATAGIDIQNATAGATFDFGDTDVGSTGTAVNLISSPSASFAFDSLDITTSTGSGLNANNGGTLSIGGTDNTISATTGTALGLVETTIGGSGLTFQSISAGTGSDSAGTGIILDNTGTNGGLTVTGDGSTSGSGGTIQHKTGADGSDSGIGIRLSQTQDISLSFVQLNDFDNFAIRGTDVTRFTLSSSTIDGTNGSSAAHDEGSVSFGNLLGTATFSNTTISGGHEDNLVVTNNTSTLDRMVVTGGTIGLNSTTNGNDGILVEAQGSATVNLTVSGMTFLGARGDLIQANSLGTSTMDLIIQDNTFQNDHTNSLGGGITLSGGSNTSNIALSYDVSGTSPNSQTFRDSVSNAVTINIVNGAGTATGTIHNNKIGISGVAGSGSSTGSGIAIGSNVNVAHTVTIDNNDIDGIAGFAGIDLNGSNGSPTINATVTNNTIDEFSGFALAGIYTMSGGSGSSDTAAVCADIRSNTIDASAVGGFDYFIDQINAPSTSSSTYNLPGYGGPATPGASPNALDTFLGGQNTLFGGVTGFDSSAAVNVTGTGTSCP